MRCRGKKIGLIYHNFKFILEHVSDSAEDEYPQTLTLGRQQLYLRQDGLGRLKSEYGFRTDQQADFGKINDQLLSDIIDSKIHSIDYSDYEGADIVHDLGVELPSQYCGQYDIVIDGGTLEHVFNFPVAIANCMKLVKVGGWLFLFQMANNHLGHGFYQFSPELFYRVFSTENGFKVENMYLLEHSYPGLEIGSWYRCWKVADPDKLRKRVGLVNAQPVCIMVAARKIQDVEILRNNPVQSDYQAIYNNCKGVSGQENRPGIKSLIRNVLPAGLISRYYGWRDLREYSFANREFYTRIDW